MTLSNTATADKPASLLTVDPLSPDVYPRELDADATFHAMAEALDDGWMDMVAEAKAIAAVPLPQTAQVASDAEIASRFIDPDFDVHAALIARAHAATTNEAARLGTIMRRLAAQSVQTRALSWIREHMPAMCAHIAAERADIHKQLRMIARDLEPLATSDDLAKHPALTESYSAGVALLASWDSLTQTHHRLIDTRQAAVSNAIRRFPGIDWVHNIDEAWPEFQRREPFTIDVGHPVPGSRGMAGPWDSSALLDRIRAIGRFTPWAPTASEIEREARRLEQVQAIKRAVDAEEALDEHARGIPTASYGTLGAYQVG
jgi:hypothetical protein